MIGWRRTLREAGVATPQLRADFTETARIVRRFDPAVYAMLRLLLPPVHQPNAIVAIAFVTYTDNQSDGGPLADVHRRAARFTRWEQDARSALDGEACDHALLRALLHAIGRNELMRTHALAYLDGAWLDLDFGGFANDEDFQRYIDGYDLPACMLYMSSLRPGSDEAYRASCRMFIEPAQRLDFLVDLAADLRDGRLALLHSDLDRSGVTRDDLEHGRDTAGVRKLVAETCGRVRRALPGARTLSAVTPLECRPMNEALVALFEQRLDAAERHGAAVTREPPRRQIPAFLRILHRARRRRLAAASGSGSRTSTPGRAEHGVPALGPREGPGRSPEG